jgi:hypothetical protein
MPDLTTEYYYYCETAEGFQMEVEGSKTYTVRWDRTSHKNYREVQYDYSCTCHAYKFGRGKYCKHIQQVIDSGKHCNWQQFTDGGEPVEKDGEKCCPKCGSPVRAMGYGV